METLKRLSEQATSYEEVIMVDVIKKGNSKSFIRKLWQTQILMISFM